MYQRAAALLHVVANRRVLCDHVSLMSAMKRRHIYAGTIQLARAVL